MAADEGSGAGEGMPERRRYARKKDSVRWSQRLADRLCARLAEGELLHTVLREPGWPTPTTVARWMKDKPAFDIGSFIEGEMPKSGDIVRAEKMVSLA